MERGFFFTHDDALSSVSSGCKIKYGSWSSSSTITLSCDFYPVSIIVSSQYDRRTLLGCVRPGTNLTGNQNYTLTTAELTWGDTSIQVSGNTNITEDWKYYCIFGT